MTAALARITCYNDLVEAFRRRKADLGLSDQALDDRAGLCSGHTGKLLGPSREKGIGATTIGALMDALGVSFIMIEDAAKMARGGEIEQRRENRVHESSRLSKFALKRARRQVLFEAASHAAKARWERTSPAERKAVVASLNEARMAKQKRRPRTRTRKAA